ncbi:MAG: transcription elongation factor GreB [Bacteriovoracaceae bacterium]|nr:transcription elongation factor GreB [Bacteriovoracaceae bacterium]
MNTIKEIKEKNYISQSGFDRLKNEFDQLYFTERPEIVKVVQWAASNGDRSENADYLYGKRRMREIDRRLSFLSKRLELAIIVDYLSFAPSTQENSKIRFGATVKISSISETQKIVTIVGVDEVDINKNYISWKSPLGIALMGKEAGDECIVRAPQGDIEYEVLEFFYAKY